MAITGKRWTAVWRRQYDSYTNTIITSIDYNRYQTTPAEILTHYPTLVADSYHGVISTGVLRSNYLTHNDPPFGAYDTDEDAMLDVTHYDGTYGIGDVGGSCKWSNASTAWRIDDIWSSPTELWAQFPDNPTLAETTVTPFGAYGNGLIRYQVINFGGVHTEIPTPPVPLPTDPFNVYIVGVTDLVYIFTPYESASEDGVPPDDGVGEPGLEDTTINLRVWGFSLDGHDFYVLKLGPSETLVYDLTTGQWSSWASPGMDSWRANIGQNWVGMGFDTFQTYGYNSDVIAGDAGSGTLWILDPTVGRDDRSTVDSDSFNRIVTGGVRVMGRETIPCGAVTLDLSVGNPTQLNATITLEISDDAGNTWVSCGSKDVLAGDFNTTVEWRSLGLIKAPGRIFKITDTGTSVRIGALNLR